MSNMDEELAYLAGFFDGEGCVSISTRTHGGYGLMVSVSQLNPMPLLLLRSRFGGSISRSRDRRGFRTMVVWTAGARIAANAIREMRPLLAVKADEVDLALAFQDGLDSWTDKVAEIDRRARMAAELQRLKRRTYDHIEIPKVEHAIRQSSPRRLESHGTRPSKPKPPKKHRVKAAPVKSTGYDRGKKPSREVLERTYQEAGLTITAAAFGVSRQTVVNWLDKEGIPKAGRTPASEARRSAAVARSWR